ncbi:MAG TPA: tRNA (N6-isopentenyl adenosine(37)-C2)-methylthiotransferase MiaB [Pyrinomonadaceae bacterium]|nr:tRNA (N6-isopentenyl adenosine(37)-C2)-methylthiotransferase MiaB [Pyrinomonadaceae bacterium]
MKKVYLETFGCQMNVSDSERVASSLAQKGYEITLSEDLADVILINTCSVREKAEQKLYTRVGEIRKARQIKPVVGVMGCVAQLEGETLFKKISGIDAIVGTRAVGRISSVIDRVLNGEDNIVDLGEREQNYDWNVAEPQRHSPYVAFVPIIEGCNKFCTYCIVPFSRGREISLPASEIIRSVLSLRRSGIREVHLIGQNVNSYRPTTESGLEGVRGSTPFSRLLRAVAATGVERVKFNTSFPRDFKADIVDAINENENLCNWIHLPVQSGSDRVLRMMKRGHTIESYRRKIEKIRSSARDISITTDIIVGFPGETCQDFDQTVDLVNFTGYDAAYIFKYSPRPGTPAFAMDDNVLPHEKTRRFRELEAIQRTVQGERMRRYVGRTLDVLVEKRATRSECQVTGHSTCHKVVNFEGTDDLFGRIVKVKISEVKPNSLLGELCN